jgi:exopolyphosphatase / guanosine-5'-triphosphate,3'-diphosphate pyrophosphatase
MREGILHDMLGRAEQRDQRDASIAALAERYGVDGDQAARVEQSALQLFDQVAPTLGLSDEDRRMLAWAARIHEIGLSIAHSQYHVHGAYVVEHSDIAGFSTQEQQTLSALVRCQRRSPSIARIDALPERLSTPARHMMLLLRLAVLLHRGHDRQSAPDVRLAIHARALELQVPAGWLSTHPLTRSDLDVERELLDEAGFQLRVEGCARELPAVRAMPPAN